MNCVAYDFFSLPSLFNNKWILSILAAPLTFRFVARHCIYCSLLLQLQLPINFHSDRLYYYFNLIFALLLRVCEDRRFWPTQVKHLSHKVTSAIYEWERNSERPRRKFNENTRCVCVWATRFYFNSIRLVRRHFILLILNRDFAAMTVLRAFFYEMDQ